MKLPVYRDPPGQTVTSVDTKRFENESLATVGDLVQYSPGVQVYQGNSARDMNISIRGSGARSSTGLSNIVVLEDGFSMTPVNGGGTNIATTLGMAPQAYGGVDVYRGGSSALFGNYAMSGAVNFRMRSGAQIDGFETGHEYGSFGSVQNWLVAGKKYKDFDISLFASDARSDGYMFHTDWESQSFNVLATWAPTATDRIVFKGVQTDWLSHMDGRDNWFQFLNNPFQRKYGCAYLNAVNTPYCTVLGGGAVTANAVFGAAAAAQSPTAVGMHRRQARDIVGLRWEHDLDDKTTFRVQGLYDLFIMDQPNNPTQQVKDGHTPTLDFQTDVTSHVPLFGMPATHYLNFFYANAHQTNNQYRVVPNNFAWGAVGAIANPTSNFQSDMGLKAREELALTKDITGVVGFSSTWTKVWGFSTTPTFTSAVTQALPQTVSAARAYWNYAPEAALTWRYSPEWQFRARYETAYATPAASALFTDPSGLPGNNTALKPQTSQGGDFGVDWTPANMNLKASLTIYNEWWRNQFISLTSASGVSSFTSNIPASIHRGVETTVEWRPVEGLQLVGNYSFTDQFVTNFRDALSTGTNKPALYIQRAGLRIPAVAQHQFVGRIGYDVPYGEFKGLGGFVEYVQRSDAPLDNANIVWAPGYGIVNLDLHYNREFDNGFLKKFGVYFQVKNLFDRTYFSSAAVVSDALVAGTIVQQPASVLSNSISVLPGSPRAFIGGVRFKF